MSSFFGPCRIKGPVFGTLKKSKGSSPDSSHSPWRCRVWYQSVNRSEVYGMKTFPEPAEDRTELRMGWCAATGSAMVLSWPCPLPLTADNGCETAIVSSKHASFGTLPTCRPCKMQQTCCQTSHFAVDARPCRKVSWMYPSHRPVCLYLNEIRDCLHCQLTHVLLA